MKDLPAFPNMAGARLRSVEKCDYSWFFTFADAGTISTKSAWRFINHDGIHVTSEDHGHSFGLPNPVDASARVLAAVQDLAIQSARIDLLTGDLCVYFSDKIFLQFLQMSGGYEGWQFTIGNRRFICLGGGEICTFPDP